MLLSAKPSKPPFHPPSSSPAPPSAAPGPHLSVLFQLPSKKPRHCAGTKPRKGPASHDAAGSAPASEDGDAPDDEGRVADPAAILASSIVASRAPAAPPITESNLSTE
ncbi:hypothetical protein Vretimale_8900 [Volvox reticuliferus]|uniref:Uncharacterized protein n=1 Tax=Volvox reticuliferus TaxID=1737510 RepID=A0A8J4GCG9_9CHLO|nr:hypothetical protein Vretimale_8900 [Volvox reticuliferus]